MYNGVHTKATEIWSGSDYKSHTVRLFEAERDHIINGHGIMGHNFTAVYDTVENPDSVYTSGEGGNRDVFFKKSTKATYDPKFFTKAVVQYNDADTEGYIVTAFPADKEGGNIGTRTYPKSEL